MSSILWFRMYDPDNKDPQKGGMHLIDPADAARWNEQDFGIFWTVNEFKSQRRVNDELHRIRAWAIDIDKMDKFLLIKKLSEEAKLIPSRIVETKSGLHVYWNALDATPEFYRSIVEDRLGWLYEGDPKAKDLARVLRVPGFWHCKNPENKFMVRTVWEKNVAYSQAEMIATFKLPRMHDEQLVIKKQELRQSVQTAGDNFFDKLWSMDQMDALKVLSGSDAVKGERYEFRKSPKGRFNIMVNGNDSGCFIGENRKIGSGDGGGPTVGNWLNWFGRSWKDTIKILKQHFPELREEGDPK